ncbi:hypothetical protein FRX31_017631 [Thalictrum thalictroides]|uniref:Uncharacterized protein n=1 Tax=Thalictrum thalictroides TaxID=46969 RepID=A0A7J6W6E2_THATH|nr:hypothetical protein FRX31_017631 [Thalictrum thalictroides]
MSFLHQIATGVFTYEDWKRDIKTHRCRVCDEVGHHQSDCNWMELRPTSARVSRFAEVVCWCCGEPPEINHPGVPLLDVALRAQLKRNPKKNLFMLLTDGVYDDSKILAGYYVLGHYSELPHLAGAKQHSATSPAEGLAIRNGLRCAVSESVQCIVLFSDSTIWKDAIEGR